MKLTLEVIAVTVADAVAAAVGGADRLELVANLGEGGTTPSPGVIHAVRQAVDIPIYVMIRPRGGGFVYSPREMEAMVVDARAAKEMGADGIVLGALRPDGGIDMPVVAQILEAARLPATFHRAFDHTPDLLAALRELASLPHIERVLTSGGCPDAHAGRAVLAALVREGGPVEVMPGGGVTLENAREILTQTGARALHVGTAVREPQTATGPVKAERVRQLRTLLDMVETLR